MKNQNLLDQFFLKDEEIIKLLVETASFKKSDAVLEIGAGSGVITRELVKKSSKVIAVEIDKTFAKDLKQIPGNIQLIFADALGVLKNKKTDRLKFNKIVGSLPSSIIEPLVNILVKTDFETAVFLVPLKFSYKLIKQPIFVDYFDTVIVMKVPRKSFYPTPKANWALVKMIKKPDPLKTGERARFLRQYIYSHPKAKTENALTEGLVRFYRAQGKSLTKKQAKTLVVTQNPL
ncbi:hypothetical protein COT03_01965 [Candidatus Shapirobacteria bacterium CG07_land_8_20_14_0_80_39_18]|uniref:Ribosomal RNA adenine methylase transferase N-terminal domain-containing protein n=1 Tax=Candidatus Shapirobacteria bacterium CG07_land_8_20_14_0_80_39_18 TaxID=1974882 RepID=A0A2M6YR92_9BACT|nr:MAG: hypothetical protein COT03_01965 [Candidatus Shapirobacteria bacterium CG07_land_8_20_14_0_80_39_18]